MLAGTIAIAGGVYIGLYLWNQQQAKDNAALAEWCVLRAEYWARIEPALRRMEPECIAIGIRP